MFCAKRTLNSSHNPYFMRQKAIYSAPHEPCIHQCCCNVMQCAAVYLTFIETTKAEAGVPENPISCAKRGRVMYSAPNEPYIPSTRHS
mmetsp:Transcript_74078/g.120263  ORF Transcript_74078/g.120263 Transcript_74078/m.120263 type:complete len:88 (-) Transcript_74078:24-287(-)